MYEVIVVGTDGSETAAVAVRHATEIAKLSGATLHIVVAYKLVATTQVAMATTLTSWPDDLDQVNESIASESELTCSRAATEARREGIEVNTHTRPGEAADVLVAIAEELDADLLVIGNRGMTGVRRFVLGSVPNKISHHCPCSLLIVETAHT
jgi:nucleotide-binding universal stress UspA family protein